MTRGNEIKETDGTPLLTDSPTVAVERITSVHFSCVPKKGEPQTVIQKLTAFLARRRKKWFK